VFPGNPDDPAATGVANLRASLNRVRQSGRPDTMAIQKYDVRRPDGTFDERYWSPINSPVFGADHALEYIIHRVEDVTEFVRQKSQSTEGGADLRTRLEQMEAKIFLNSRELESANRQLYTANIELARASKLKDEFLANMSHELRTPLNAILGLSETLLEQISGPLTPKQIKSVTTISTSGQHLLALINDILDLSKIEAGKLELRIETVSIRDFCQGCLAFVQTQAVQKQIGVACEIAPGLRQFQADPRRFKQALVNLLTNAVKFTPLGGHIGLTVTAPAEEAVIQFTVWDTGIGIAPTDQGKLFKAFTQVDSGLNRTQEGTGLGLALVARLVEMHNGCVTLVSDPGKGSRFTVTLPWQPPPAPGTAEDGRALSVAGSGVVGTAAPGAHHFHRALVIEDDPTAAEQLVRYLTGLGLSSGVHPRGEEVLTAVLREQPDIILLDLLLPDGDGWQVLARLREHPQTRTIPVAVVSVVDEPEKSFALGASAHFTKPVSRDQLAAFLRRPLPSRAPAAPQAVAPAPAAPGPTILLAEDNEANIQTIGGYLMELGYDMHYALNGLTAVKLARDLCPALILMDIQMPMMDGLSAIREIRADARLKHIPIIALTALAMPGDRERCLSDGATDYMSKPVSLKALRALVERLLPPAGEGRTPCG
jgi:signal transduction histidine kinase/CheY-like chemotaxis protein